jgi:hypothetical protein
MRLTKAYFGSLSSFLGRGVTAQLSNRRVRTRTSASKTVILTTPCLTALKGFCLVEGQIGE